MNTETFLSWRDVVIRVEGAPLSLIRTVTSGLDPIRVARFKICEPWSVPAVVVIFKESDVVPRVDVEGGRTVVRGSVEYWSGAERFACVLLQAVDGHRLENSRVILHGAAVAIGDSAVLLTGPSDAGKTTTALQLCTSYGARLISNDHILLEPDAGGFMAEPSDDTRLAFRSQALFLSRRDLYKAEYGDQGDVNVYKRSRVEPAVLGIRTCSERLPLRAIVTVGLGMVVGTEFYPTPRDRKTVALHADMTSRIRAADLILKTDADREEAPPALPSLVTEAIWEGTRLAVARLSTVPAWDAKGDPESISSAIVEAVNSVGGEPT